MATTTSRKRRKPGIGPLGIASLLVAAVGCFLAWRDSIQMAVRATLAVAYCVAIMYSVPVTTWFFSSRPRLFVRVFVPHDEYRDAVCSILRDPGFRRSMRQMGILQAVLTSGLGATWYLVGAG